MTTEATPQTDLNATDVTGVYLKHNKRVRSWARRFVRAPSMVDDVVQDVFMVVHMKWGTHVPTAQVSTWLYGITRNVAYNHSRKIARTSCRESAHRELVAAAPPDPEERMNAVHTLSSLSDRDRSLLLTSVLAPGSSSNAAQALGLSSPALFTALHRLRKRLE